MNPDAETRGEIGDNDRFGVHPKTETGKLGEKGVKVLMRGPSKGTVRTDTGILAFARACGMGRLQRKGTDISYSQ